MASNLSIGIFDSGFGGLTVMRAIMQALPHENIIYFGDTARLPYGNKSPETLIRYSKENARFLVDQGIKALVVACHTACSAAFTELQNSCPVPVIGVIPSAIEEAISLSKQGNIAVLGTRSTIQSNVYQKELQKQLPKSQVHAIACPLFVPLVEEGFIDHPLTLSAIREYLAPLKHHNLESIILGCTHYPLLAPLIQKELGHHIILVDPAQGCATRLRRLLDENHLHTPHPTPPYPFYVSDDPHKFRQIGPAFLNYPLDHVHLTT